ncbi:MAG: hypothetical protein ACI8UZ_002695 [Akkermansiaceae bacterium]|jgi:hypothetical protein
MSLGLLLLGLGDVGRAEVEGFGGGAEEGFFFLE